MADKKPWEKYSSGPQPIMADPAQGARTRQAENEALASELDPALQAARIQQARASAAASAASAANSSANAEGARMSNEAERIELGDLLQGQQAQDIMAAYKTNNVLTAIRNARAIAREGGTGFESLLAGMPAARARTLQNELQPILANAAFDRLQEMRNASKTGGALGQVSERELNLLQSTISSLDTGDTQEAFLRRLDEIEQHFLRAQIAGMGVDPASEQGVSVMREQFGYTGVSDEEIPTNDAGLADPNATQGGNILPEEYQREHLRYLRDNWGQMNPGDYASFRVGLDERFGFTPNLNEYASAVEGFNAASEQGVAPDQLGAVPSPTEALGGIEQGINSAAQSSGGAFFANAGNAVAAGLPAYLGGNQNQLELLREARPAASFGGEMFGGALGTAVLPGGVGVRGGSIAQNILRPYAAETGHSALYGATQDDNALRGAATGAAGAVAGSFLGQKLGNALPGTFAPKAIREADETVPSVNQLKEEAGQLYLDVQAQGAQAGPEATEQLAASPRQILAREGRVDGNGNYLLEDGPTRRAVQQLESYGGQPLGPQQAMQVRETLGEGITSPVPKDRRIAGMLLDQFDDWADTNAVLPNAGAARDTYRRAMQGQQLEQLTGRAVRRGRRLKGNDAADSVRTLYGQLDEQVGLGNTNFSQQSKDAIAQVAQGDKLTNAARAAGKYGWQNPLTSGGIGVGGATAYAGAVDPIYATMGATAATAGSLARKVANDRTLRQAREAELLTLGGDEYAEVLEIAKEIASQRSGRIFGGLFGAGGSYANRQSQ